MEDKVGGGRRGGVVWRGRGENKGGEDLAGGTGPEVGVKRRDPRHIPMCSPRFWAGRDSSHM